jgi:hypothetical protein
MNGKEPEINPEVCQIVAVRELSASRFGYFRKHLLEDSDFIADIAEELHGTDHDGTRCLLVLGEGYPYGILVNSEGYTYARYSGIMPHARELIDSYLEKLADYCVSEGSENTEDGKWTISFDELYEHFGTEIAPNNGWGEMLLAKLKDRDEIDTIIATEDEFEIQYHLEHCPQCREGSIEGAMSLMSLLGCNLTDIHVTATGYESCDEVIPHLNPTTLSEEGKAEFSDVLSASVVCLSGDKMVLSGCSYDRVKRFSDVLCGNCSINDYYRYVSPHEGENRPTYRTLTQEEVNIACAKHLLWLYDQPDGVRADFSGCELYGLDLSRKNILNAVFADCIMRNCSFKETELCGSSFCKSQINNCDFEAAYTEDTDWSDASVRNSNFQKAELSGSNLCGSVWDTVNVDYARLQNCCLADAEFPNTYLEGAYTGGSVYDRNEWDNNTGMIIRQ